MDHELAGCTGSASVQTYLGLGTRKKKRPWNSKCNKDLKKVYQFTKIINRYYYQKHKINIVTSFNKNISLKN